MRSTFSTPLAADNGVSASTSFGGRALPTGLPLLSGKYLTFSSVLVISPVYLILEAGQAPPASVAATHTGDDTMTANLPQPLADYFSAKNRHDIDAMLVPFSSDA